MSNTPIRVGIVGAGFAASFHYEVLRRVYGLPVEITGITSIDPAMHEKFAKERGIKPFDSVADLLKAVDVVDICAPPYAHAPVVIQAAEAGRHIIVEKPFTGSFLNQELYEQQPVKNGTFGEQRYREAVASAASMVDAVRRNKVILNFAENWHFLPAGLKAARLLMRAVRKKQKTGPWQWTETGEIDSGERILFIRAEESHSGSHSNVYGDLRYAGGGSIVGKACHPLGLALYLKRLEGMLLEKKPVVPVAVSGQMAWFTKRNYRRPDYENPWKLRDNYKDGEDWGAIDIVFSDDTRARVESSEIKLGGVYNWFEVFGNKFFFRGNMNPQNELTAFAPSPEIFLPEYLVEKTETHGGWSQPATDEDLAHGYVQEMQIFFRRIREPKKHWEPPYLDPEQDLELAMDSVKCMYGAYLSAERNSAYVRIDEDV